LKHSALVIAITFAILLFALGSSAVADDQTWRITTDRERVRYSTHGSTVHGHKFGLVKHKGSCNNDNLWISWSTTDSKVRALTGTPAQLELTVGNVSVPLGVELTATVPLTSRTTLIAFTNHWASPRLIDLLSKGEKAKVKVTGPDALVNHLDIREDTFSLVGFIQGRAESRKTCLSFADA